jgi:hypothetical protein
MVRTRKVLEEALHEFGELSGLQETHERIDHLAAAQRHHCGQARHLHLQGITDEAHGARHRNLHHQHHTHTKERGWRDKPAVRGWDCCPR